MAHNRSKSQQNYKMQGHPTLPRLHKTGFKRWLSQYTECRVSVYTQNPWRAGGSDEVGKKGAQKDFGVHLEVDVAIAVESWDFFFGENVAIALTPASVRHSLDSSSKNRSQETRDRTHSSYLRGRLSARGSQSAWEETDADARQGEPSRGCNADARARLVWHGASGGVREGGTVVAPG